MQLEVGSVVEGKVTGMTKFGAFVELPGGKTGMVHISEVAQAYVKEISDHLSENQVVKVKILGVTPEGKISLSIKKCLDDAAAPQQPRRRPGPAQNSGSSAPRETRPQNRGWQPKRQAPTEGMSFEDMMSRFKQTSDDKMSDLKRATGEVRRARRGKASN
jgi:S1 RNA binding domain protein